GSGQALEEPFDPTIFVQEPVLGGKGKTGPALQLSGAQGQVGGGWGSPARIGPLSGPHPLFAGGTLGLRPGRGPSPDPGAPPTGPSGGHRACRALAARRKPKTVF